MTVSHLFNGWSIKGRSIEERPAIVSEGTEIGHWEVDTVVGKREGREAVTFTAVEKVTRNYIAIRIPGRSSAGVESFGISSPKVHRWNHSAMRTF